jgi:DNA repair protein RadC
MDYLQLSDRELLAELIGKRGAEQLCRRSLSELIAEAEKDTHTYGKLLAALEIVRRALRENLRRDGKQLSSPRTVRDYLQLTFIGKEHGKRSACTVLR